MTERFNKYVHLTKVEGKGFLFHLATGEVCALDDGLFQLIADNFQVPENIAQRHPDFYDALQSGGFLVNTDTDETEALLEEFKKQDSDPSTFDIIVNPTLDCNLRCWYCYEEHLKGTTMNAEVLESIKRLVDKKLEDSRLRHLGIFFFGGEPLLRWKDVVMPLLKYGAEKCREKDICFSTGFTTNGVLLTKDKFEALDELGLKGTSFQISFDGNKTFHDKSRVYDESHPTFDRMLEAVRLGAEMGFDMCARFNYTPDNLESFDEVLSIMATWPAETKRMVTVNLQQVWQTSTGLVNETRTAAVKKQDYIRELGLKAQSDFIFYRHVCYADKENHIVVNYNGDVYKCTARKFDRDKMEGILQADGELVLNELYNERMSLKYSNPECRCCKIMPICNGRCSQAKLERKEKTGCIIEADESYKDLYLIGSLYYHLTDHSLSIDEIEELSVVQKRTHEPCVSKKEYHFETYSSIQQKTSL